MNKLTEEQKEKALKRFVYCQEYYKKYQPEHKNECIQNTNKYIDKIKSNPEKLEEFKNKKKILSKSWKGKICEVMRKETSFKKTFG